MKYNNLKGNKVFANISWMLISRVINILSGVLVSIIVTRYLGAEQKGELTKVISIASFFSFFASFGLGDILIREFTANRDRSKEIASTAASLMFFGGMLSFGFAIALAVLLKVDLYTGKLIAIYASVYLIQFLRVFEYWYYSQSESKIYTIGQFIIYIMGLGLRVIGVVTESGILWFVLCACFESVSSCVVIFTGYKFLKTKMQGQWRVNKNILIRLVKLCLPIIMTGVASSIYMRIDQIMIGKMMNNVDLGIYSVAVNLAEYWYFVPGVVYMSLLPVLTNAYEDEKRFVIMLQKLADIMVGIGYAAIIGVALFGTYIINVLYGQEFSRSSYVLMLYIWSGLFTCLSYTGQAYFIIQKNTNILMYIQLIGAVLNFVLNLIFIPVMGIYGAAVATLLQYVILAFGQMFILGKKHAVLYKAEIRAFMPFRRLLLMMIAIIRRTI